MPIYRFTSRSEADTDRFGEKVAPLLQPGDVIALVGTLGAGKTRFVQGVAVALGIPRESITSPTFVLVNEYRSGRLPLFHFDVYRLKDDDEFLELGPDEYFDDAGATFIEWGNKVEHLLPERASLITITPVDRDVREFVVEGGLAGRLENRA